MKIIKTDDGFDIYFDNIKIISHTKRNPLIHIGRGEAQFNMYRGNFDIKDYVVERIGLTDFEIKGNNIRLSRGDSFVNLEINESGGRYRVDFKETSEDINRYWIRVAADEEEKVYGCGEQLSYFNLRGKNFPLWTSEPGVGRNKNTYTTWQADVIDKAGGDYYNTNYPQPTYVSTKKYYCHLETTAYADFDFRNKDFHELQVWEKPKFIQFESASTYIDLLEKLTAYFGRQPKLPEWIYDGIILGIQGGTDLVIDKMEKAIDAGVKVGGLWCQDWQGINMTSFGKRLWWNWEWCDKTYPELDKKIYELKDRGVRFLGYVNPYVIVGDNLYKEAAEKGYLAFNKEGGIYNVDFGEFYCGIVDFTNGSAHQWYKEVIKKNMIDFGLDGWMADFGEYLPTDCVLSNGVSAEIMHNAWPTMWAKTNYEAVKEAGKLEEIMYFMRAGYTGTQKYCTMIWGGDQSVNWSIDDGLASVIPAALSSGMTGNGLHHSDIGGYTSLHGNKRSQELFMRWTEMNAFTPMMRSHEGNRPYDNHQFDTDKETLDHLAKMTNVFVGLKEYLKDLVEENSVKGTPVQRPLFLHYEDDSRTYDIKYQYLLGKDLMVAPVYSEGVDKWDLYLPEDEWVHLWSGQEYRGGDITVDAPLGKPPVFYRKNSKYYSLFSDLV